MTASSPVTMEDLVNGLVLTESSGAGCRIVLMEGSYKIAVGSRGFNTVSISSDGLTVTFGSWSEGGPTFTGFTFNA